ncbi:MAG TPA: ABC transporter substrate-binding protein [Stellaceae bacterium]|nr:ABC transporter substrate-binding protein [Stellaceae bacterium]
MSSGGRFLRRALWILAALLSATPAFAADPLAICLDENVPLYSRHDKGGSSGFFVALSEAIAARLGRSLKIQWFETKLDADSSSTLEANALLSDRRCMLVGGYPLVESALGKPGTDTARLPDFAGATPVDRHRRVALGTLVLSRAYLYAPMTVVLGPTRHQAVKSLGDLDGLKLGIEASTLGDVVLMLYKNGRHIDHLMHVAPGRDELLPRLERGEFEATLVDLRRFDAYRVQHPDSKITPTGFFYRAGINMGYVGLASEMTLINQVNAVIDDMLAQNEMARLAAKIGLTYVPPHQPEISPELTLRDLRED